MKTKLLSDHVVESAEQYRQSFNSASPFRYVVIDDFFTSAAWERLVEEFPSHGSNIGLVGDYGAKNSIKGGKSDLPSFGPTYVDLDSHFQSAEFLDLISTISGVEEPLYDPTYNGAGIHENFAGNRNRLHIDYNYHPKFRWHRRLNLSVYITPDWKADFGGGLKLVENGFDPGEGTRKVVPCLGNRCVLFETTEHSWHGVESIVVPDKAADLTRKSITCYFYSQDRPIEEAVARHSTIYVPDRLLLDAQVGDTLTEADVRALRSYQRNVRKLIKSLYGEHGRLIARLDRLEQNNSKLRKRVARVEQPGAKMRTKVSHLRSKHKRSKPGS